MTLEDLKENIWNSNFNKTHYEVPFDFYHLKETLYYWSCTTDLKATTARFDAISKTFNEVLEKIVPEFQRDNDKWTQDMQIKFVENIVLGATSTIILGSTTGQKSECVLIDGLQRITAIFAFMNNEFKIFDKFEFNEDFEQICRHIHNLTLRIYNFKNEQEMVKFYIDMNENITHSKSDIKRTKDYLEKLKMCI